MALVPRVTAAPQLLKTLKEPSQELHQPESNGVKLSVQEQSHATAPPVSTVGWPHASCVVSGPPHCQGVRLGPPIAAGVRCQMCAADARTAHCPPPRRACPAAAAWRLQRQNQGCPVHIFYSRNQHSFTECVVALYCGDEKRPLARATRSLPRALQEQGAVLRGVIGAFCSISGADARPGRCARSVGPLHAPRPRKSSCVDVLLGQPPTAIARCGCVPLNHPTTRDAAQDAPRA
jgi:hypothetical protein